MKSILCIFAFSFLAAGCSSTSQPMASQQALGAQSLSPQLFSFTSNNATLFPTGQALPQGYATNSRIIPANASFTGNWVTNIPVNPAAYRNTPATTGNGIYVQGSGNTPSLFSNPNGTVISPTSISPGLSSTPAGLIITPPTK